MDEQESTIEELLERLQHAEENFKKSSTKLNDLIDYLTRKGVLEYNIQSFEDWRSQLEELRREEARQKKIETAKRMLQADGYIVAKDQNELDAQVVKNWVTTKERKEK